jgi:hypothetical protein
VKQTPAQILLGIHLAELGFRVTAEHYFCERDWRFDWADQKAKLAFECNGGMWTGGHRRGKRIEQENDKLNTATALGWKVFVFTNAQILDGRAKAFLSEFF